MCKSCGCETTGKNPLQEWHEMSDDCAHMRHEGFEAGVPIRFCLFNGIVEGAGMQQQFCTIDDCPRLRIEVPSDIFASCGNYGGIEGIFTTFYGATKKETQNRADSYRKERACESYGQGWMPYKGYVIYFVRLKLCSVEKNGLVV
jgi:hypothetical protein